MSNDLKTLGDDRGGPFNQKQSIYPIRIKQHSNLPVCAGFVCFTGKTPRGLAVKNRFRAALNWFIPVEFARRCEYPDAEVFYRKAVSVACNSFSKLNPRVRH